MKDKLIILGALIILAQSCGVNEYDETSNYPTTIYPLSSDKLSKYQSEYQTLNNNKVCTSLNEYGFCEYDLTPCMDRSILRTEITDETKMINMAKEFISKNSKFTGISNIDELQLSSSTGVHGCIKCDGSEGDIKNINWRVCFANQIYNGYEVFNTDLFIFLDINGVYMIGGNWYPKINIPDSNEFDLEKAKQSLYGHKISFLCWTPINITVSAENIQEDARKVIIPYKIEDRIELRVAWEILIYSSGSTPLWIIYVDVMTGEIIMEYSRIIC
jgi:hypothetical protein